MQFLFDEDQLLLQQTLRGFLAKEWTPAHVRALWEADAGHSPELWARLAELGVPGLMVPEERGGLGMDELAGVLLFEEVGRAALGEALVTTAGAAAPLLREVSRPEAASWLEAIAAGRAVVAVGCAPSPFVADADVASLLLLQHGDEVHAVPAAEAERVREPATDPTRRLFSVRWQPGAGTRWAAGEAGRRLWAAALDRGALAAAAQLLGVAEQLLDLAVAYAGQRQQFGRPIGSFQAVKHMLANVKVELEYARPAVQRAAHSVARALSARALHVSMAKVLASRAAAAAAKTALQVHGAIGYTWEQDLHLWMRRAWSLEQAWGRSDFHRHRVEEFLLDAGARIGPGETFAGD